MSADSMSSASVSAGPVATAPPPPAKLSSELTFVQEQAANAKAAFKQTLGEMVNDLSQATSIKNWMHAHPWLVMSSATAAGFVAGCIAIPSKDETLNDKFEDLKAALHRHGSDNHGHAGDDNGRAPKKSFLASVVGDLIKAAVPVIGAIVADAAQQPPPAESDATATS